MANYIYSDQERLYPVLETTYGIVPAASAGDYCKHISGGLVWAPDVQQRADKTGIFSQIPGVVIFRNGSWSVKLTLAGSGVAGTVPDADVLWRCLFGKAASAGVYSLDDLIPSFSLYSYRVSGAIQRVASGCIVNDCQIAWGQNFVEVTFGGPCKWIIDSASIGGLDSDGKGGLSSIAAEPSSPVWSGSPVPGNMFALTVGSFAMNLSGAGSLKFAMNRELGRIGGKIYAQVPKMGRRTITLDVEAYDDDSGSMATLISNSVLTVVTNTGSLVLGYLTGNIFTFALAKMEPLTVALDDSGRCWTNKLSWQCNSSDGVAKDEITMTCG